MSSYVRSVDLKLEWKQKHWKKRDGMVTQQPTPEEERALAETLACLPTLKRLSLEWTSQPDADAPAPLFAAVTATLAPRLLTLALHAPVAELREFADAADAALLNNIQHLTVFSLFPRHSTGHADQLAVLGRCLATAGSARLQSLKLTLSPAIYWNRQIPIAPCFIAMTQSHFEALRALDLTFSFQALSEEAADALLTLFHHVARTLESLSLDVLCVSSNDVTQRQLWVERWIAPLAALRKLELEWKRPEDLSMANPQLLRWLPQIRDSKARLTDLTIFGLRLTPESLARLVDGFAASCPTLLRLQLTADRLVPRTITLLAASCPNLTELDLRFHWIGGGGSAEANETYDAWSCRHDLWQGALEVRYLLTKTLDAHLTGAVQRFAVGSRACDDQWGLQRAVLTYIRHGGPCAECWPGTLSVVSEALRHFAPSADVSVVTNTK